MDQDTTPAARAWQLLADGATTTQIARALGIPPSAVEPLLDQARAAQPEPATCQLNRGAAAAEAPADPKRAAYIDGLRQLADVLEAHAELPLPYEGSRTAMTFFFLFSEDPRAAMAAAVRALPCNLVKNFSGYDDGPSYLDLSGQLGDASSSNSSVPVAVRPARRPEDRADRPPRRRLHPPRHRHRGP